MTAHQMWGQCPQSRRPKLIGKCDSKLMPAHHADTQSAEFKDRLQCQSWRGMPVSRSLRLGIESILIRVGHTLGVQRLRVYLKTNWLLLSEEASNAKAPMRISCLFLQCVLLAWDAKAPMCISYQFLQCFVGFDRESADAHFVPVFIKHHRNAPSAFLNNFNGLRQKSARRHVHTVHMACAAPRHVHTVHMARQPKKGRNVNSLILKS